ncbi:MAG: ATP-binding protein [Hyphomicrobiaceae bacterium]
MTQVNTLKISDIFRLAPLSSGELFWGFGFVLSTVALDAVSTIGLYRDIGVTPWSPSAGLALSFAYIRGIRIWPFVVTGVALSNLLVLKSPHEFWVLVLNSVATSSIWLYAGIFLKRLPDLDPMLRTMRSALLLMAVAFSAALCDTIVSVGLLWLDGAIEGWKVVGAGWRTLVGDVVGTLVVMPLVLLLRGGWPWPKPQLVHLLQFSVLIAALAIIFGYRSASTYQLFYLLFLPILWVALRDGVGGAVLALNACQLGIIIGAQFRFGINPGTGSLQMMMIVLSITGLLIGVVVTEREAAARWFRNQQAAMSRQLRLRSAGETAAAIAHQINQPLTAISTYASIASEALNDGDAQAAKAPMDKLVGECERAAGVLKSVRDLVKQGAMMHEPVNLRRIVTDLAQLHAEDCRTNRIALQVAVPANLPAIECDRVQLEQALENLINNSIEAIADSGRSGTIIISAHIRDEAAIIEVSDDGPGFAPGLDAIATTPFMTTKENGSGLGLAIARSVAEAHGGSLSVVPQNNGATVRLTLPSRRRNTT